MLDNGEDAATTSEFLMNPCQWYILRMNMEKIKSRSPPLTV